MADLTRWEPFRRMLSLREAMDRLLAEGFTRPEGWPFASGAMAWSIGR